MVNWQLTAITIFCDAVDDEVTLLVYKDGLVKCTGYDKYGEPGRKIPVRKKSKQSNQQSECDGPECYRAIQYRDKLFNEEAEKDAQGKMEK